MTAMTDTDS